MTSSGDGSEAFSVWPGLGGPPPLRASLGGDELGRRRAAVSELGSALREATAVAVVAEGDVAQLELAARAVRDATALLAGSTRQVGQVPLVDDTGRSLRMFNPVVGLGNPAAPPARIWATGPGQVSGTCELGLQFEGPVGWVHGGVSAMLMDQMVGHVSATIGNPGLTASLTVDYRRAVPLCTPLVMEASLGELDGRKTWATAFIARATEPDVHLVEARGLLVALTAAQVAAMFDKAVAP